MPGGSTCLKLISWLANILIVLVDKHDVVLLVNMLSLNRIRHMYKVNNNVQTVLGERLRIANLSKDFEE